MSQRPTAFLAPPIDIGVSKIGDRTMELESLMTRYFALQQELANAYSHRPWESGHIDVLAKQLISTEQAIVAMRRPHNAHREITHHVPA